MARIRMVKPELFDDPDLGTLSLAARFVYIGLFTQADRRGRLEDDPRLLKNRLLGYDTTSMHDALTELDDAHFIIRYAVNGKRYIQIRTFEKHQKPHPKEPESEIPAYREMSSRGKTRRAAEKHGEPRKETANPSESGSLDSGSLDSCERSTCASPERRALSADARPSIPNGFASFWTAYPRKVGKGAAEAEWLKLKPDEALGTAILAAVDAQKGCDDWLRDGGKFIPHPRTWLHQRRWEDEPRQAGVHVTPPLPPAFDPTHVTPPLPPLRRPS